jgi:hypothetical protein
VERLLASNAPSAVRGQRAAYSLTERDIQTMPVMVAVGFWGLAIAEGHLNCESERSSCATADRRFSEQFTDELRETHVGTPRRRPDQPRASEQPQRAYEQSAGSGRHH